MFERLRDIASNETTVLKFSRHCTALNLSPFAGLAFVYHLQIPVKQLPVDTLQVVGSESTNLWRLLLAISDDPSFEDRSILWVETRPSNVCAGNGLFALLPFQKGEPITIYLGRPYEVSNTYNCFFMLNESLV